MLARLIVAGVGIPLLLSILFLPGGGAFWGFMLLLGGVSVLEMARAMRQKGERVHPLGPALGAMLIISLPVEPYGSRFALPGLIALFMAGLTWYGLKGGQETFRQVSQGLLLAAYPGLLAVPVALRGVEGEAPFFLMNRPVERGAAWVLIALLMVWVTDTGAFFVGRAWGKRKLAPRLSPSKTVEGAVGGWLFASLLGLWLGYGTRGTLFSGPLSGLCLGMCAGVAAQVGDLVESSIKRELGVKDFGGWLPGHGGALDRFDSFLFVCPLVYVWVYFF